MSQDGGRLEGHIPAKLGYVFCHCLTRNWLYVSTAASEKVRVRPAGAEGHNVWCVWQETDLAEA